MKDPAFLFYSSDFLTGVADLTMEERGQYITMLCIQHQKGICSSKWLSISLPNASSDVLSKFEKDGEGNYYSKRLRDEIEKRKSYKPKKDAAACLGGLISSYKVKGDKSTIIRHEFNVDDYIELPKDEMKQSISKWFKQMLNLLENENEIKNYLSKINKQSNSKVTDAPNKIISNWIENAFETEKANTAWLDWIEHKVNKSGSFNRVEQRHSYNILRELATVAGVFSENNVAKLIATAIRKGWKDFYLTDEMEAKKRKAEMP
jgi:hypothetical protein